MHAQNESQNCTVRLMNFPLLPRLPWVKPTLAAAALPSPSAVASTLPPPPFSPVCQSSLNTVLNMTASLAAAAAALQHSLTRENHLPANAPPLSVDASFLLLTFIYILIWGNLIMCLKINDIFKYQLDALARAFSICLLHCCFLMHSLLLSLSSLFTDITSLHIFCGYFNIWLNSARLSIGATFPFWEEKREKSKR